MASNSILVYCTVFFLFLQCSSTVSAGRTPSSAATEILSNSGYFSMAITLQITYSALNLSDFPNLTVFAPSDLAFVQSGQPSLLELQYQISPERLSGETLEDLPFGAKIPSLRLDAPLIVTGASDSSGKISINDASVQDSALFDDGYVVIYGTDEFFKPLSQTSHRIVPAPGPSPGSSPTSRMTSVPNSPPGSSPNSPISSSPNSLPSSSPVSPTSSSPNLPPGSSPNSLPGLSSNSPHTSSPNFLSDSRLGSPDVSSSDSPAASTPSFPNPSGLSPNLPFNSLPKSLTHSTPIFPGSLSGFDLEINVFEQASSLLMSSGYAIMGTFLDLQLESSTNQTRLTIFAPVDEAIAESITNFSNYSMIFRGHVVQKLLSWKELREVGDGTILRSALRGFMINVSWSGNILLLNDVPVVFPDMYVSDWIAIHGINKMIIPQVKPNQMGESFSELDGGDEDDHQYSTDFGEYGAR